MVRVQQACVLGVWSWRARGEGGPRKKRCDELEARMRWGWRGRDGGGRGRVREGLGVRAVPAQGSAARHQGEQSEGKDKERGRRGVDVCLRGACCGKSRCSTSNGDAKSSQRCEIKFGGEDEEPCCPPGSEPSTFAARACRQAHFIGNKQVERPDLGRNERHHIAVLANQENSGAGQRQQQRGHKGRSPTHRAGVTHFASQQQQMKRLQVMEIFPHLGDFFVNEMLKAHQNDPSLVIQVTSPSPTLCHPPPPLPLPPSFPQRGPRPRPPLIRLLLAGSLGGKHPSLPRAHRPNRQHV
eukprot:763314-Hanusia_phi.AAC.2